MADTNPTTSSEISLLGKITAGFLLIAMTVAAIVMMMAYWPNKMPDFKVGDDGAWYTRQCFNVTLIECKDTSSKLTRPVPQAGNDSLKKNAVAGKDSLGARKDSSQLKPKDSAHKQEAVSQNGSDDCNPCNVKKRIHLNTILLLLVALMGFLGNMIHIATSFTTFVGNDSFKRSWVLWYFVKPFTAAGLALIVYFIIRAGFLSYGSGASGISLYGILAISALAGLFTDSATLKLKEVFEVIFKPKDERTDKLGDTVIASVSPLTIPATGEATITLAGKSLDKAGLKISVDGQAVTAASITADAVTFKYTPTAAAISARKAVLLVQDKDGKTLSTKDISITQ